MKKKITAIITLICLMIPMAVSAFWDTDNHWAKEYIDTMTEMGYVSGYPDNSFKPDNMITRAEFASVLCNVYGLPVPEDDRYIFFEDVAATDWYAKYTPSMAVLLPLYDDLLFHGERALTRYEAAYAMVIVNNCEFAYDNSAAMDMEDYESFSYDELVSSVVSTAIENGIMLGRDGKFEPFESLTRAELSTLIVRMAEEWGTYFPSELLEEEIEAIAELFDYYGISDFEYDDSYIYEDDYDDYFEEDYEEDVEEYYPEYKDDYYEEPGNAAEENTSVDENPLEYQVLKIVNEERAKEGIAPLEWDDNLAAVAKAHSEDMAANNFFDHTNLDGLSPFDRMRNYGISYGAAAENIAAGSRTAEAVMNQWMNSEGHHANIMNPNYKKLGVGIGNGGTYGVYWTQCFTD